METVKTTKIIIKVVAGSVIGAIGILVFIKGMSQLFYNTFEGIGMMAGSAAVVYAGLKILR